MFMHPVSSSTTTKTKTTTTGGHNFMSVTTRLKTITKDRSKLLHFFKLLHQNHIMVETV